jgi:hypothetical protein
MFASSCANNVVSSLHCPLVAVIFVSISLVLYIEPGLGMGVIVNERNVEVQMLLPSALCGSHTTPVHPPAFGSTR